MVWSCDATATTAVYTLSLHDALPISARPRRQGGNREEEKKDGRPTHERSIDGGKEYQSIEKRRRSIERARKRPAALRGRSEEHTSELQSLTNLVCRLLLEKNKTSDGR